MIIYKAAILVDKKLAIEKKKDLIEGLKELHYLIVAFSGGVDSTFLLAAAFEAVGNNVTAVTLNSIVHPEKDLERAKKFTGKLGIKHLIIESNEMDSPEFYRNPPDRCYHCKKIICKKLRQAALENGVDHIAHAINTDDLGDYRPGIKAAEEMGLLAPLVVAGLNKSEIRYLSKEMKLSTWNKQAMACLASRIPYGEIITKEKIEMIARAEDYLSEDGFTRYRVRHHGAVARIEVSIDDIGRFMEKDFRNKYIALFKELGFKHIALDLEGFISGSMNRELPENFNES
jgi:uncharacterized protein